MSHVYVIAYLLIVVFLRSNSLRQNAEQKAVYSLASSEC